MCHMISSWVRHVLSIAKGHMFLCTVHVALVSAALVNGVSLMSILQTGDWARASTLGRHCFSTYISTVDWHQDTFQCAVSGFG